MYPLQETEDTMDPLQETGDTMYPLQETRDTIYPLEETDAPEPYWGTTKTEGRNIEVTQYAK